MGLSACYSASLTTDKNRFLRVTVIGADKTTGMLCQLQYILPKFQ